MVEEDTNAEQPTRRLWFINLNWFTQNNRSFSALARGYLCPACLERLKLPSAEITPGDLLGAISDCCAKKPGFIHGDLPILESVFRLFLAKRNQPLDLEELSRQLNERRGGNGYRTSPVVLSRLLESDRHYGLSRAED